MPIRWTASPAERLVTAAVSGEATREEFERYLAEVHAAGAMPFRKILDLSFAPMSLRAADIKALGRVMAEYAKDGPLGPLAIVVDADSTREASALYGQAASVDRPFAIFGRPAEAREWLDNVAPLPPG
ncbi:MAG: hypothetical protein KF889_30650 [Alphaproteobacteria bacterium]|nr:hypothetical protein [Alphaproteobacteria bacterium]MCW5742921.1 hypothetical protein [Alphaproteobacteria bacterium]